MISVVAQTHLVALYRLSAAANAKEEAAYRALVKVRRQGAPEGEARAAWMMAKREADEKRQLWNSACEVAVLDELERLGVDLDGAELEERLTASVAMRKSEGV